MSIDFKKVKRYIKESSGYKLLSQWVSSHTVEMDDGSILEDKMDEKADKADVYDKEYMDSNFAPGGTLYTFVGQKGWYRIAKMQGGALSHAQGGINYSCTLSIKRGNANGTPEYHKLQILSMYQGSRIVDICDASTDAQLITAVRHTVDSSDNTTYIEFYYNSTYANSVYFTLMDNVNTHFKLILPELTEETVSGVDVLSKLELPANFDINYLYKKLNVGKEGYSYPYNCVMTSGLNLNNVNESGLYFCEEPINAPDVPGNGFMIAITYAREIRGMQLYMPLTEDAIYKRQNTSGTWGNWKEIKAGSATSATKLETSRTIGLSGDISGSTSFDGTSNKTITATLANSGVTAGTYGPLELLSKEGTTWVSNNIGLHNTSAISTWKAKQACKISFKYKVSSESSTYDYLKITAGGTTILNNTGGETEQSGTLTATLGTGQSLVFTYKKDSSTNKGADRAEISEVKYGSGTSTPSTAIYENNVETYFTIENSKYGFYPGTPMANFTVDAKGRITKEQTVYVPKDVAHGSEIVPNNDLSVTKTLFKSTTGYFISYSTTLNIDISSLYSSYINNGDKIIDICFLAGDGQNGGYMSDCPFPRGAFHIFLSPDDSKYESSSWEYRVITTLNLPVLNSTTNNPFYIQANISASKILSINIASNNSLYIFSAVATIL